MPGTFQPAHGLRVTGQGRLPPRGSRRAAPIACGGLVTAHAVAGREYHYRKCHRVRRCLRPIVMDADRSPVGSWRHHDRRSLIVCSRMLCMQFSRFACWSNSRRLYYNLAFLISKRTNGPSAWTVSPPFKLKMQNFLIPEEFYQFH